VVGRGSRFWVEAPFPIASETELAPRDPAGVVAPERLANQGSAVVAEVPPTITREDLGSVPPLGLSVLVAEDNEVNQAVSVDMLALCGCSAHVVVDGRHALEAMQAGNWDLVLMDCQMPEMDGFTATREVRAWEKRSGMPHVPIVALTANAMQGDEERCRAAGMDDYLTKPFELRELWRKLSAWRDVTMQRRSAATAAAIDPGAIRTLRSLRPDDPSSAARVIRAYLKSSQRLVAQVRTATNTHNPKDVHVAAHTLKSACAYVGAHRVRKLASDLEFRARDEQLADAGPIVDALTAEAARAVEELERILLALEPRTP
jgi:CheY-like chemotaxis protein